MQKRSKKKSKTPSNKNSDKTSRGLQLSKLEESSLAEFEDVTPIIAFLEMFQELSDPRAQMPLKLISLKVPVPLLDAFKFRCQTMGVPYQTMIKRLMKDWLGHHSSRE
jgi:predicted DNA binding CopG/RHH family protein